MINAKTTLLAQGIVSRPRVSGDGRIVIWNQQVGDKTELMKYEEGEIVNLSNSSTTHDLDGDISYDGSVIAWRRAHADGTELVASFDGKERVLDGFPADISRISVSDDGSAIVYDENTQGTFSYNIRRFKDGEIEQVTDSKSFEAFPFVSADGERIVYTKLDGKNRLMLKDGQAPPKEIVRRKESAIEPELSADGNLLLFSEKSEGDFDLYSRDLNSGEYKVLQSRKSFFEREAKLASETGEILFTGYDFRKGRPAETNLYLDSGKGEEPLQLTRSEGGRNYSPDFSENGKTLVWVWTDQDDLKNRRIYMMEPSKTHHSNF